MVKSEDIPAATQFFTPNWVVKYMVQNSLGVQGLATYPLPHYADQRIQRDLDDGVKVNYGKSGDLLAEVKKVTSKEADS